MNQPNQPGSGGALGKGHQHKAGAMQAIKAAAQKDNVNLGVHEQHIQSILDSPGVQPLWDALDKGDAGDQQGAMTDGDAQLQRTLLTVRGITDYVLSHSTSGAAKSQLVQRTSKALDYALHGTPIS